ncbi:hypothetical protein GCK72_019802 [Caenorhabditis remanei]|uniref:F-box domain-containing protein n=1 Tax=Caenorhabditis remanei TaxID=31234 RepID=A0A6A5GEW9_CAERE|nr:hypothetical protein GCK72_019802 [Caenorhabditis remanei]KAF1753246.1 hypothetical protein GCK72_019802 [Caenorhabditis remanei]
MEWIDLPDDSKREVFKRLDLMSRYAMRCVSHADREVVDSTDLYVPRVRFSQGRDNKALIVVYTGIEEFLRMEFSEMKEARGTMIHRLQNSYDLNEASVKVLPYDEKTSVEVAGSILKTLFVHKSILIGTMEFEFSEGSEMIQIITFGLLTRSLDGNPLYPVNVFRVKKMATNWYMKSEVINAIREVLLSKEDLVESDNDILKIYPNMAPPVMAFDRTFEIDDRQKIFRQTRTFMGVNMQTLLNYARTTDGMTTGRFIKDEQRAIWDLDPTPITRFSDQIQMKRFMNESYGLVVRYYKSDCGVWMHIMPPHFEKKFATFLKNETCGLRYLCKKCADPFEYWFYQNLPRRLCNEPEWLNIIYRPYARFPNELKKYNKIVEESLKVAAEDEKRRKKAAKNKRRKEKQLAGVETPEVEVIKSWGFKKTAAKNN